MDAPPYGRAVSDAPPHSGLSPIAVFRHYCSRHLICIVPFTCRGPSHPCQGIASRLAVARGIPTGIAPRGRRCRACGTFPSSYRSSAHLPTTMGSSDSCGRFRAAGLPSSRCSFPDAPPLYAPPCFPRRKSNPTLLFGFTLNDTLAAWSFGVNGT